MKIKKVETYEVNGKVFDTLGKAESHVNDLIGKQVTEM